jgi:hypothetical protein
MAASSACSTSSTSSSTNAWRSAQSQDQSPSIHQCPIRPLSAASIPGHVRSENGPGVVARPGWRMFVTKFAHRFGRNPGRRRRISRSPPALCNELRGEGGVSAPLAVSKAKVKALSTKHGCDLRRIGKHATRRHNLAKGGVDRVANLPRALMAQAWSIQTIPKTMGSDIGTKQKACSVAS